MKWEPSPTPQEREALTLAVGMSTLLTILFGPFYGCANMTLVMLVAVWFDQRR